MFICLFPFPKIIIISFPQTIQNKYFKHMQITINTSNIFLTYSVIYHSSYCTYIPFAPGFEKGIKPKYIILSASEHLLVYFFIYIFTNLNSLSLFCFKNSQLRQKCLKFISSSAESDSMSIESSCFLVF